MIDKTFGYFIKCDECRGWLIDKHHHPKMFYDRVDLQNYAVKKGWHIEPFNKTFCPNCWANNKVVATPC